MFIKIKKLLILFIFSILVVFTATVYAESVLGLGFGNMILPSNPGIYTSLFTPNGENVSTPYIYWNESARDGYGYGFSFSGYYIKKFIADYSGNLDAEWNVSQYSIFSQYQIPLTSNKVSPLLGLRLGVTIAQITLDASAAVSSLSFDRSDNETKFGPYFGVDLQIPLENTSFVVFGVIEKSIVSSTMLTEDIEVGTLTYAVGLGYRFK